MNIIFNALGLILFVGGMLGLFILPNGPMSIPGIALVISGAVLMVGGTLLYTIEAASRKLSDIGALLASADLAGKGIQMSNSQKDRTASAIDRSLQ